MSSTLKNRIKSLEDMCGGLSIEQQDIIFQVWCSSIIEGVIKEPDTQEELIKAAHKIELESGSTNSETIEAYKTELLFKFEGGMCDPAFW
jgi:hypothetical protein